MEQGGHRIELPPQVRRLLSLSSRVALTAVVLYLGWTFLGRYLSQQRWRQHQRTAAASREAEFQKVYNAPGLRILQFYARDGILLQGGQTVICYGVVDAAAVRIDPPIENLSPSLNRCIEAAPERNTRYTLTAQNAAGQSLSSSFEILVKPNPADLPRIAYFRAGMPRLEDGRYVFKLEFAQQNGDLVEIDPPVFPALHGAPISQFYVAPRQTTTYVLTVTGKHGRQARQSLTVRIP